MSAWLITGGAGFVGSNFVRMAHGETQAKLVVLDALTYAGNLDNLADLLDSPRLEFVHGDILDEALLRDLFTRHAFTRVVHFAAESHVDRSILGPTAFIKTNIQGTTTMLEAAREAWTEPGGRRFLHISTDEVFGTLEPDDPPFCEQTPYRPNSPYAASKAAADHIVRAWHQTYGLPTLISNCSNNYGPWQFPEKLVPLTILNAVEEKPLPVYGDGLQMRDWLHVDDHCRALLAILERGRIGGTYTVGGEKQSTNLEIVFRICDAVDEQIGRRPGTSRRLIRHVVDRPGHDRRYAVDSTRLETELGWRPLNTISTALPKLVHWYLEHKDWADRIRSGEYRSYYDSQYGPRLGRLDAS